MLQESVDALFDNGRRGRDNELVKITKSLQNVEGKQELDKIS